MQLNIVDKMLNIDYYSTCKQCTTISEVKNKVENNVKYLRQSKGYDLTQEELAKELGVSRHTIISIEKGGYTSGELMLRIADFFKKDPREIFFINGVAHSVQGDENKAI